MAISLGEAMLTVTLTIVLDEYEPHGLLKAIDEEGNDVASKRVTANFSLTRASATAWAEKGFH